MDQPGSDSSPLEEKLKEKENQYLYLYADFENFKKRVQKEKSDLIRFGAENLARNLLSVLDNMERALTHASPENHKALVEGISMVAKQFQGALEQAGVTRVNSLAQAFDPFVHEAVGQMPSEEQPAGTVVQEEQSGYLYHDRLLRPAKVIVSSGPANSS